MTEAGDYQPQPTSDPIAPTQETGNPERAVGFITSLINQRSEDARYKSKEIQMYNLLHDLVAETSPSEYPDFVERNPLYKIPGLSDMVERVLLGYGSLIFDKLPPNKQALFLHQARREQEEVRGGEELELTEVEGNILKSIAAAVGVEYDPGNPEQRTFQLADIEKQAPDPATVDYPFNRSFDPSTSSS